MQPKYRSGGRPATSARCIQYSCITGLCCRRFPVREASNSYLTPAAAVYRWQTRCVCAQRGTISIAAIWLSSFYQQTFSAADTFRHKKCAFTLNLVPVVEFGITPTGFTYQQKIEQSAGFTDVLHFINQSLRCSHDQMSLIKCELVITVSRSTFH